MVLNTSAKSEVNGTISLRLLKIAAASAKVFSMKKTYRLNKKEQDETEFLLSSPANREHLEKAIENVKQGKVITFATLDDAIACALSKTKK